MTYAMKILEEREEGREEGRKEERISMALEMLRKNTPLDFIASVSKLSVEKISELGKLHGIL